MSKPVLYLPKKRYKVFSKALDRHEAWAVMMHDDYDVRPEKKGKLCGSK